MQSFHKWSWSSSFFETAVHNPGIAVPPGSATVASRPTGCPVSASPLVTNNPSIALQCSVKQILHARNIQKCIKMIRICQNIIIEFKRRSRYTQRLYHMWILKDVVGKQLSTIHVSKYAVFVLSYILSNYNQAHAISVNNASIYSHQTLYMVRCPRTYGSIYAT